MAKSRKRNRRGAIVVLTAILFLSLVGVMAIVIDFSRLWTVRNELQTGADAAALAGAMQLVAPRDSLAYADSARSFGHRNRALSDTIQVDSIVLGVFDDVTQVFTPTVGTLGPPSDAVSVVTSYMPSRMWMRSFGATVPRMKARAIAWAGAPVAAPAECVKPWAIPYEVLMAAINTYRGIANDNTSMNRAFDQVADFQALQNMSDNQRTFTLKMAQNSVGHTGAVNQVGATAGSMPGNFQAVRLGKSWDYATQSPASPGPGRGGRDYDDWIDGTNGCATLAVGDSLETEPGDKVGPTLRAIEPAMCSTITDNNGSNLATHGDCVQSDGTVGREVVTSFYACGTGCTGQSTVAVKLMGSFTLKKVYPDDDSGPPASRQWEKSQIVGTVKPIQGSGPAGGGSTTLRKLILVK